jgi:hypothetical protein
MLACGPISAFATARRRSSLGPIRTKDNALILSDSVSFMEVDITLFSLTHTGENCSGSTYYSLI